MRGDHVGPAGSPVTVARVGGVFDAEGRERLRTRLVEAARADPRISAAATTGSGALDRLDRWSDIDLALAVAADRDGVVADWTTRLYDEGAVTHLDVWRRETRFRVFLMSDTLQVDVAFWPAAAFGPIGPAFRVLFGGVGDPGPRPTRDAAEQVGLGWLYALHVRSSLARGRVWQAETMLGHLRGAVLALACLRHGLPAAEGRGLDDLPAVDLLPAGLPTALDPPELYRAFAACVERLLAEAAHVDPAVTTRLTPLLRTLTDPPP